MPVDRRRFLRNAGVAAVTAGTLGACARDESPAGGDATAARREWRMVTAWPAGFPGLSDGAERLAARITAASGDRLRIKVYTGGELVAPFEVFDAVSQAKAEMGHAAAYYWKAKAEAAPFFCAVPFGLTAQEMNAWLAFGGGLTLWRELYARFKLVPFAVGNTGAQLAGWSNREITTVRDLVGMRMRIPGLGGEVFARCGGVPVNLPGTEIFSALQSGTLDAAEWVGPYNDLAFGLFRAAKYCYWPGWQEPGCTIECLINQDAWASLPEELQTIVTACCAAENDAMLAEFTAQNQRALETLTREHKVEFRRLPDPVLAVLRTAATAVLDEIAARDAFARRVYDSWRQFRDQSRAWHAVADLAFYQSRN
jgi:TRAP-type mannitol/chloroaromatic compound transport system substrate-binding protein